MTQTVDQMTDAELTQAKAEVSEGKRKSGCGIMSAKIIDGGNAGRTIGEVMALEMIDRELQRRNLK